LLVPRGALLYGENGPYVYKQLARKAGDETTRYAALEVTLLMPFGDGYVVAGLEDDDEIVVRRAGVLWSLEGMGVPVRDDDD
jgi:hypothetical protein